MKRNALSSPKESRWFLSASEESGKLDSVENERGRVESVRMPSELERNDALSGI